MSLAGSVLSLELRFPLHVERLQSCGRSLLSHYSIGHFSH